MLKVVPLEGALVVNGEQQLGASDLLGETTITLTLSALRRPDGDCVTNAFVEAYGVEVCCSSYAPQLIQVDFLRLLHCLLIAVLTDQP